MSFMLFNAGEDAEVFQHLAAENASPFLKSRFMKPQKRKLKNWISTSSEILPSWHEN